MSLRDGQCPICGCTYSIRFLQIHVASCGEPIGHGTSKKLKKRPHSSKDYRRERSNLPILQMPLMKDAHACRALLRPVRTNENEQGIPGFYVFYEVMDVELEAELVRMAHEEAPPFADYRHRLSKAYGPPYNIAERRFDWEKRQYPLPEYATRIILPMVNERITFIRESNFCPNQLSMQLYDPKRQGRRNVHILPHNDCENGRLGPFIIGVTLNAACTMTFILQAKYSRLGKDVKRDVRLPRRSFYVMSGPALRIWRHGIFAGKTEGARYSLTFREVISDNTKSRQHGIKPPSQQTAGATAAILNRQGLGSEKSLARRFKQSRLSFPSALAGRVAKRRKYLN